MSEWLARLDFAWPWAWLLLPLPWLVQFLLPGDPPEQDSVRVPFLPELIETLKPTSPHAVSDIRTRLQFWPIWLLLVCALARPEYIMPPQQMIQPMRNIVLALDVSGSMEKNDADGRITRLQAVQKTVKTFIAKRKDDRIGLVIFASQAWPFAPLSADKNALLTRISQLSPGMIGQQTAIGDALGVAVKQLDSSLATDAGKMVILLTDGNDTASQLPPILAAQLAAAHHVLVHTIAFGDSDSSGEDKVDLELLQQIAQQTGGRMWQAAKGGESLDQVWQQIDALTPQQVKTLGWSWHRPLFHWPLTAALLLLLLVTLLQRIKEGRS
ncbi:MAG: VWA domain-containing protein [Pantoea sp.]|uniref:VWA domain-containing protein n=1 Tax=Pantoea sp. TaxID=69393 RepID=UPI0039E3B58D